MIYSMTRSKARVEARTPLEAMPCFLVIHTTKSRYTPRQLEYLYAIQLVISAGEYRHTASGVGAGVASVQSEDTHLMRPMVYGYISSVGSKSSGYDTKSPMGPVM